MGLSDLGSDIQSEAQALSASAGNCEHPYPTRGIMCATAHDAALVGSVARRQRDSLLTAAGCQPYLP